MEAQISNLEGYFEDLKNIGKKNNNLIAKLNESRKDALSLSEKIGGLEQKFLTLKFKIVALQKRKISRVSI